MLTRRTVLKSCAAIAGPAVLNVSAAAPSVPARQGALAIEAFVVDARSEDALAVADHVSAHGVPSRECKHDLAELYYGWLAHSWQRRGAVGGVTGAAPLFYLERLAWSHGLRVVFLGRHTPALESWIHAVRGPQAMVDTFRAGARLTDWRRALVRSLLSAPSAAAPLRPLSAVRDAAISGDSALFSWVLA